MRRFFIQNFGCRATQADGAALGSLLAGRGLEEASHPSSAELVILNSCTVTAAADDDLRQTARRVHRQNPDANILITGCYAQRAPEELAALPGVRWVVGNSHKYDIPNILIDATPMVDFHGQIHVGDILSDPAHTFLAAPVHPGGDRARPILKIQDGCNNRCSFCIIPSVRGRSRSASADDVVAQVRALSRHHREIVLSGINLGRWGRDAGRPQEIRLAGLIRRLLMETPLQRLRLSSVEPMDWSDELLELVAASPRIAKHVHAPLQSGCDAVLKRMKRKYRARHYENRLLTAWRSMPDAAIGADVMAGFPGETDAEFEESRSFIARMPFNYLHVFTYSERPGTPAAGAGAVPMVVRKHRNRILRDLAAEKNLAFRRSFLGRRLSVVTLQDGKSAMSGNYLKVELARPREPGLLLEVTIGELSGDGMREQGLLPILQAI